MSVLVDTGILLRLFVPADPECGTIRRALMQLRRDAIPATTAQNIAEFWNVSTRPPGVRGGYGLVPSVVEARVRFIERRFHIMTESLASFFKWKELASRHALKGVSVHDARLAAIMLCGRIDRVLTLNPDDFRRYKADGIEGITPAAIVGQ